MCVCVCVCAETPLAQMTVYAAAAGSHVGSHVETAIQRVTVITGKLRCAEGPRTGWFQA